MGGVTDSGEKLTDVFSAAALKYLTAVDASPEKSNQHEIGGLVRPSGFGNALGMPDDGSKQYFHTVMMYLDDFSDEPIICEDKVSWYDTRYDDPTRSPEWRLYYPGNEVTDRFQSSDMMLIALTYDRTLLMMFCPQSSQAELQLRALFGASERTADEKFRKVHIETSSIAAPIRLMLARYGIELDIRKQGDDVLLDQLISKFGNKFPSTKEFSAFARALRNTDVSIEDDPDSALLQWMNDEEHIFRLLERAIVQKQLEKGFGESGVDVDEFIKISLSIQNRRKSRVGHAFENHIEEILRQNRVRYERGVHTEGKQKPDFLFPSQVAYLDPQYPESELQMLGAKTTCKERWRQILAEANRIAQKHLITLEPSVSSDQTDEMKEKGLQLVVPVPIQSTYKHEQQEWLISFKQFIEGLPR
ncbi:type II restriction endonuclease [Nitrincola sp. MINF-07-Sa-05]|uniref:type II restriction endonuclease n=1 Tax=Nitrincola salilacus TaxID=3400273 RepID=UPI00391826A0